MSRILVVVFRELLKILQIAIWNIFIAKRRIAAGPQGDIAGVIVERIPVIIIGKQRDCCQNFRRCLFVIFDTVFHPGDFRSPDDIQKIHCGVIFSVT